MALPSLFSRCENWPGPCIGLHLGVRCIRVVGGDRGAGAAVPGMVLATGRGQNARWPVTILRGAVIPG